MIKILIDSASDIDAEEAKALGVEMIPMEVRFGDNVFLDGVDLSHKRFFEMLIESAEIPKTSQINEFRFEEKLSEMTKNGDDVLVITMSSKLSGTFNCAKSASKKFAGKVVVVDSANVTIGERILCNLALKLIQKGNLSLSEVANELENQKKKIHLLALLDTLKYLKKGGRISSVVAFTGEVFSIKPVVSVVDGEVKMIGKAMGSRKGNNLLMQLLEKCGGINFDKPYALAYSGLSDELLKKYIHDSESLWKNNVKSMNDIPTFMIGSTIGTHAGPGAIAVAFFEN